MDREGHLGRARHRKRSSDSDLTGFTHIHYYQASTLTMFIDSLVNRTFIFANKQSYHPLHLSLKNIRPQHRARTAKGVSSRSFVKHGIRLELTRRSSASLQASHLPIYMRPPRARLYLGTYLLHCLNDPKQYVDMDHP